ncbi:hypothetical protein AB1Y20_008103 [Prymnesium parvum]|uniref:Uncharacterized protein n=1 Tax=Prymnesium parvum TaxID=97485 RepID=A0AB34IUH4_PRYPA
MAAAAAAAPRVFFQYAHPGGAVVDARAIFDARGAMDLYVTSDADVAELDSLLPADLSVKRLGGGRAAVAYGDLAKILFPLVDIAPEVAPLAVGASFFSAQAWSRWWEVLHSFMATRRGRQDEYPAYMHAALGARASATDAQRVALTVIPADLEGTEDTRPDAAAGAAAPADTRGFLMQLTYGSLRSQRRTLIVAARSWRATMHTGPRAYVPLGHCPCHRATEQGSVPRVRA